MTDKGVYILKSKRNQIHTEHLNLHISKQQQQQQQQKKNPNNNKKLQLLNNQQNQSSGGKGDVTKFNKLDLV